MDKKSKDMIIDKGSYQVIISGEWQDKQKEALPMYKSIRDNSKFIKEKNKK